MMELEEAKAEAAASTEAAAAAVAVADALIADAAAAVAKVEAGAVAKVDAVIAQTETGCVGSEAAQQKEEEAAAHTAGGDDASDVMMVAPMTPPLEGVNLRHFPCSTAVYTDYYFLWKNDVWLYFKTIADQIRYYNGEVDVQWFDFIDGTFHSSNPNPIINDALLSTLSGTHIGVHDDPFQWLINRNKFFPVLQEFLKTYFLLSVGTDKVIIVDTGSKQPVYCSTILHDLARRCKHHLEQNGNNHLQSDFLKFPDAQPTPKVYELQV